MRREIGRERTNPLSRTKAAMGLGYTPICTAKKAIRATRNIGMVEQASLLAESRSMRNGSALWKDCWGRPITSHDWCFQSHRGIESTLYSQGGGVTLREAADLILLTEAELLLLGTYVNRRGVRGYFVQIKCGNHWCKVSVSHAERRVLSAESTRNSNEHWMGLLWCMWIATPGCPAGSKFHRVGSQSRLHRVEQVESRARFRKDLITRNQTCSRSASVHTGGSGR